MDERRKKVKQILVETLQEACDHDIGKTIPDSEKPSDLGLESADGVMVAPSLGTKLGITIPNRLNPLVNDQENRERNIGEIVDFLLTLMPSEERKHVKK
ncbi:MAG: hypothetical protein A2270_08035 [Elusimicrobia bacterium RIFOXYA12_FULL_51_18]|nr:MAG: hypothetical protein A2270_08035 [Elusimicrobia bacterium RIFOXYA12_FULL_51_18]OGS28561.1 MAG: hypothetical protein A2218_04955 [Elusimicrobia bacterium RIFOXYA2_FULL_53_38]